MIAAAATAASLASIGRAAVSGGSKTQEVLERTRGGGAVGDVTSCRNSRDVGSECSSSGPPQDVFVRGQSLDEPEGGYPEGELNLGIMYEEGSGTARDYEQAAFWYGRAAAPGSWWRALPACSAP